MELICDNILKLVRHKFDDNGHGQSHFSNLSKGNNFIYSRIT